MSEEISKSIEHRLTIMIRLLALSVVKGRPLNEQMQILHNAGMSVGEIASTLGKTPNNVRVQLHLLKKRSRKVGEDVDGQEE